jgi:hypothetical protein
VVKILSATEIAIVIVESASALYGFSIAYYAFARALSRQEERWVWEDFWAGRIKEEQQREDRKRQDQRAIAHRRVWLNRLLIGSTSFFLPSVFGGLLSLSWSCPCALAFAEISFFFLTTGVSGYFLFVTFSNIDETRRDMQPPPS